MYEIMAFFRLSSLHFRWGVTVYVVTWFLRGPGHWVLFLWLPAFSLKLFFLFVVFIFGHDWLWLVFSVLVSLTVSTVKFDVFLSFKLFGHELLDWFSGLSVFYWGMPVKCILSLILHAWKFRMVYFMGLLLAVTEITWVASVLTASWILHRLMSVAFIVVSLLTIKCLSVMQ